MEQITPLVAQWQKSTHPAQIRLHSYLDDIKSKLIPLFDAHLPLFLHLHVRALSEELLLNQYDLENYLTPLFGRRWIDPRRFHLVVGTKDVAAAAHITLGIAEWNPSRPSPQNWTECEVSPVGSATSKQWKEQLRSALASNSQTLPDGPVHTRIMLRCSPRRNWSSLWKPVGDAMGPVLGYTRTGQMYHPRDDRIVRLEFHRINDAALQHRVVVNYAWRMDSGCQQP